MALELTRKRARELKKLRKKADAIWEDQRALNNRAAEIARQAGSSAKAYGRETLLPTADAYARRGVDAGRNTLSKATKGWNSSVVPAIAGGLGSLAAMTQIAKDRRVQDAIDNVRRFATVPEVAGAKPVRSGPNAWQWVLIGVGAVAVVGAAAAAWQTLRADDDLWIPDSVESDYDDHGGVADGPEAGSPQA